MIEQPQTGSPKIIGFKSSGKLHDEDYKTLDGGENAIHPFASRFLPG